MAWTSQRVVVTGAAGFIGSHLTEALVQAGARVTAVVRYNSRGNDGNLRYVPSAIRRELDIRRIELTDADATRSVLDGAEVVFHLAAFVGIPYSYAHPHDVVLNNVLSTLQVLSAAREGRIGRLIQTSTSEVYGSAREIPITETHPLQPQSPYSASKIATDHIALSYHYSFDLPVTLVRPFNTFGPRQSARAVIPAVISQALTMPELKVGTTTTTRDFVYVEDTVHGFMLAAESPDAVGEVINIGTGRETRIEDAIQLILRIAGEEQRVASEKLRVVQDAPRVRPSASEVSRLCADTAKAERLLGFTPAVAFEEGIRRTVAWIREHLDAYRPEDYAT